MLPGRTGRRVSVAVLLVGLLSVGWAIPGLGSPPSPASPFGAPVRIAAVPPVHAPVAMMPHPGHHPMVRAGTPQPAAVDPNFFYVAEPAPMGIADFGLDSSGNPFNYTASQFYGDTYIRSFKTYNPSIADHNVTIQLNIVLTFDQGGASYFYWIQDVAFLDTQTNGVWFENNIWNFSGGSGAMDANSVSGNGSVLFGVVYIATAGASLPGNGVTLSYPTHIGLLCTAQVQGGKPLVKFEYRDGHGGWITYDDALFPFAAGATNINYTVDGTNYNPIGLFNDAELILGGPGGGANTTATAGSLEMSLQFYNGRNFQSIPAARNFGSDTAEAISGLQTALSANPLNGSLSDNLTFGSGSLATLFDNSTTGTVNVQTLVVGGQLVLNGTTGIPYFGIPINISIAPGTYDFAIVKGGVVQAHQSARVDAGGFLELFLAAGTVSTVTFGQTGLPTGHKWTVSFGYGLASSRSGSLSFQAINGSYGWKLTPIAGYHADAYRGTVVVTGSNVSVAINFTQVVYQVTVFESGLPGLTNWSMTVNNQTFSTNQAALHLPLPNGTFVYRLGLVPGWFPNNGPRGSLPINGLAITRSVSFHPFTYAIGMAETGLANASPWGVEVGGIWVNGSIATLLVNQPNGSYTYRIFGPAGYVASPQNGSVNVTAANVTVGVTFIPYRYPVRFVEFGLPNGTAWGVAVEGVDQRSTVPTILLLLENGSYRYVVDPVLGYTVNAGPNGTLQVSGRVQEVDIEYVPLPTLYGTLAGAFTPATAILLIDGLQRPAPGGSFRLSLPVGTHSLELTASGYVAFFDNYTVVDGSTTVVRTIHLVATSHPGNPNGSGPSGSTPTAAFALSATDMALLVGVVAMAGIALAAFVASRRRR